jgi:hypothetical protein
VVVAIFSSAVDVRFAESSSLYESSGIDKAPYISGMHCSVFAQQAAAELNPSVSMNAADADAEAEDSASFVQAAGTLRLHPKMAVGQARAKYMEAFKDIGLLIGHVENCASRAAS